MTIYKRNKLMREANTFSKENSCYIHCEMMDGNGYEQIVSGDFCELVHALVGLIASLAEHTDCSFDDVVTAIYKWHYDLDARIAKSGGKEGE